MMPIHPTLRIACALLLLTGSLDAQAQSWGASSTQEREAVQVDRDAMMAQSWTSGLDLHNIGPAVMGGRVVDLSVVGDTTYVAYATGGLWKTTNHGTTFEPLLEATTMLGAVDAHPSGRILVGSGGEFLAKLVRRRWRLPQRRRGPHVGPRRTHRDAPHWTRAHRPQPP